MKTIKDEPVKNAVYDEANGVTYEVIALRTLTDGEMFRAIRRTIIAAGKRAQRGETVVIKFEA